MELPYKMWTKQVNWENTLVWNEFFIFSIANLYILVFSIGQLDRIKIHPGKVMKIIATLKGAIKKYVGKFEFW